MKVSKEQGWTIPLRRLFKTGLNSNLLLPSCLTKIVISAIKLLKQSNIENQNVHTWDTSHRHLQKIRNHVEYNTNEGITNWPLHGSAQEQRGWPGLFSCQTSKLGVISSLGHEGLNPWWTSDTRNHNQTLIFLSRLQFDQSQTSPCDRLVQPKTCHMFVPM